MGTTTKYLQRLYRQSRDETSSDLGIQGAFVILSLKVAGVAIGVALLVAMGLLRTQDTVYRIVFTLFLSDISGFVVLYILLPVIYIFKMPKIAARNDIKQEDDK